MARAEHVSTFDARERRVEGAAVRWTEREEHDDDDDDYEEKEEKGGEENGTMNVGGKEQSFHSRSRCPHLQHR